MTAFETSLLVELSHSAVEFVDLFARAQEAALPAVSAITVPNLRRIAAASAIRTQLCQILASDPSAAPTGWRATVDAGRMMSIDLTNSDLGATARIRKERRSATALFTAPPKPRMLVTQPTLEGLEYEDGAPHRASLLFDVINPLDRDHWETPLRLVFSREDHAAGDKLSLTHSIPVLDRPGFYASAVFETSDGENEDLFANIERDEEAGLA